MPKVSIIMRSLNDIAYIEKTLKMIFSQNFTDFELINVDSGSTDGTFEIIKKYNKNIVYQIKSEDYIPGRVLNKAIEKASGDIIVFNNSDCIPTHKEWLENLIRPLENKNIAGVFGQQIPRADAKALIVKDGNRAFGSGEIVKKWKNFFSLATSAIRRDLIVEFPFNNDLQYNEDLEWSWRMKKLGYKIEYVKDAIVEHSHNYSKQGLYKRFWGEGNTEGAIYGKKYNILRHFLKPLFAEMVRDIIYLLKRNKYSEISEVFYYRPRQKWAFFIGNQDYFNNIKWSERNEKN